MVHGILPREELSRLMSELGSGGRGEVLVRALVLHRCGLSLARYFQAPATQAIEGHKKDHVDPFP